MRCGCCDIVGAVYVNCDDQTDCGAGCAWGE